MLFADGSYLFCKANTTEAQLILEVLTIYEHASSQQINRGKSTVFFSSNVIPYNKQNVCYALNIKEADNSSKCLGFPNILGRNKAVVFGYLRDKVKDTIQRWNDKKVSKQSKEILIKMVAQMLPSFSMNVFLLPLELTRDIEKCMAKFFWNTSSTGGSKINWMSRERMAKHKHSGGLGFKNLCEFNLAMLGKLCWSLLTNEDSFVTRIYKARYYVDKNFLEASIGNSPSFIWRSIVEAKEVISDGSSWRIGTGEAISILN
ncbi:putative mitochondrial protein AtMg00310 [Apium graveolens]|uniref:putative mitochondrial protein AtMg00310 n=1 Tax=Apium graveolens TaxID=4045 RepID=UPI003D7AA025